MEKRSINGFLVLNKPTGMTSNRALQMVKRIFNAKKAGFVGTLDPFASGMLPLCFGRATKLSDHLHTFPKTYVATLQLGTATRTQDTEGEVTETQPIPPLNAAMIEAALAPLRGTILQVPPMFSALKKDGQPLYKLARQGIEVVRPPREVTIYALKLIDFTQESIRFEAHCSKGTYIRVLGEDIAKNLGTVGHLTALYRKECAGFLEEELVDFAKLEACQQEEVALDALLKPLS
jgi:tRNA pseudouridine55 synthase